MDTTQLIQFPPSPSKSDYLHADTNANHTSTELDLSSTPAKSTRGRTTSKCPICRKSISNAKLENHYQEELKNMKQLECRRNGNGNTSGNSTSRSKRVAAVEASRKISSSVNGPIRSVLMKIRKNRIKRGTQITNTSNSNNRISTAMTDHYETYECCICTNVITGTLEDINTHIDQCLSNSTPNPPNNSQHLDTDNDNDNDSEFETYEWAGETRVRVISGVEGPLSSYGFSGGKEEDTTDDLDVDGDDQETYGQSQFTCDDLIQPEVSVQSTVTTIPSHSPHHSTQTSSTLMDALKSRIQELESGPQFNCLICMDKYQDPLTSIVCWHVHCKNCWLQTLASKKLCPQCNVITSPQDLRKIYL